MQYFGGVNIPATHLEIDPGKASYLDGSYKADETPLESKNSVENIGTAVFSGDRLVGELDNVETLCHLIVTSELENATITVPNPFSIDSTISVYVSLLKPTKNKLKFVNGYPFIECDVKISGNVLSIDRSINLSDPYDLNVLDSYVNTYLKDSITEYLYKTSKSLKSDIAGFGKYALPKYATWKDWEESDWLNNYENSFFKVTVETNLQSGYLYNKI